MKDKELFSVKNICDEFNITRKTLFYYDRVGLLKPSKRIGKQQSKFYDNQAKERLEMILVYRSAGLTIDEIRKIIDLNNKEQIVFALKEVKARLIEESFEKEQEIKRIDLLIKMNS